MFCRLLCWLGFHAWRWLTCPGDYVARGCRNCLKMHAKVLTPADDDDIVRRVYVRCFGCGLLCPPLPIWKHCRRDEAGKQSIVPIRDHWNAWVKSLDQRGLGGETPVQRHENTTKPTPPTNED